MSTHPCLGQAQGPLAHLDKACWHSLVLALAGMAIRGGHAILDAILAG